MPTAVITTNASIGGISIASTASRTAETQLSHEVSLAAAKSGTLTTRTDNDTGVITLGSGHGITDADIVDVYWSAGVQYGCTVTSYDSTTITVDLGSGDNLPTQDSAVTVGVQVTIDTDFDGDNLEAVLMHCDQKAHLDFQDSGDATLGEFDLTANEAFTWLSGTGTANPLTGNPVDDVKVSNGGTTAATLKIIALIDSVA